MGRGQDPFPRDDLGRRRDELDKAGEPCSGLLVRYCDFASNPVAMRPNACRLLFGLLFVAALVVAPSFCRAAEEAEDYADEDKAALIARKSITGSNVLVGGNLTVTIDIYNAGTRCGNARCVHLAIAPWRLACACRCMISSTKHMRDGALRRRFEVIASESLRCSTCLADAHFEAGRHIS